MGLHLIPNDLDINFVGYRKIAYGLSILLILVGFASIIFKGGLTYGIDFAGGATVQIKFAQPISDETLKQSLEGVALPGLAVQQYNKDGTEYLLRISAAEESSTRIRETVQKALTDRLGGISFEVPRLEMVGPKVGADLRAKALQAMYFAILIISIYVSGRFEYRWFTAGFIAVALMGSMYVLEHFLGVGPEYLVAAALTLTVVLCWRFKLIFALGAIVSILHDVLIIVGLFSLMNKEFDLTIIAALLTVVGYSLNDTIIVYDRIRENLRGNLNTPLSTIINRSINQTMSRTILTSGTTLLVIAALLIWGGGIIHNFALVMFLGVIIGTASSMFVASPVLLAFGDTVVSHAHKEEDRRARDAEGRIAPQV